MTQAWGRRVRSGAVWAAFVALAWVLFSLLFSGGAARADDAPGDGASGGLLSLVGDTLEGATSAVAPVVGEVVAPVVQTIVTPVQQTAPETASTITDVVESAPVVGEVAAPVIAGVAETAGEVASPVADALQSAPVSQLTAPVTETVEQIPALGDLLSRLGIVSAVNDLTETLDDIVGLVGQTADDTVPPVIDALAPSPEAASGADSIVELPSAAVPVDAVSRAVSGIRSGPAAVTEAARTRDVPSPDPDPTRDAVSTDSSRASSDESPQAPPGVPPTSSVVASGGMSTGSARPGPMASDALPAGPLAPGATDAALPPAPLSEADVSPD